MPLYLIDAACPACEVRTRFVQSYETEIPLIQDIMVEPTHCSKCGVQVECLDGEWEIHEETEIERVKPTAKGDN